MPPQQFDFEALFDADYRYFYEALVSPEETAGEVELIDELLGLERGSDILDLACGYGRISIGLAQRGFTVVGLDRSAALLESARRDAGAQDLGVEFVEGDMRELPWQARFDAVICWFTSFGFYDDDALRGVLRQMRRALRPGGRVLIETLNRDRLLEDFQHSTVVERDGALMVDRNTFDSLTGRTAHQRVIVRDGKTRRMEFTVRHFTFPELRDWLLGAGFEQVAGFGSEGEAFAADSGRMIVLAE